MAIVRTVIVFVTAIMGASGVLPIWVTRVAALQGVRHPVTAVLRAVHHLVTAVLQVVRHPVLLLVAHLPVLLPVLLQAAHPPADLQPTGLHFGQTFRDRPSVYM